MHHSRPHAIKPYALQLHGHQAVCWRDDGEVALAQHRAARQASAAPRCVRGRGLGRARPLWRRHGYANLVTMRDVGRAHASYAHCASHQGM